MTSLRRATRRGRERVAGVVADREQAHLRDRRRDAQQLGDLGLVLQVERGPRRADATSAGGELEAPHPGKHRAVVGRDLALRLVAAADGRAASTARARAPRRGDRPGTWPSRSRAGCARRHAPRRCRRGMADRPRRTAWRWRPSSSGSSMIIHRLRSRFPPIGAWPASSMHSSRTSYGHGPGEVQPLANLLGGGQQTIDLVEVESGSGVVRHVGLSWRSWRAVIVTHRPDPPSTALALRARHPQPLR